MKKLLFTAIILGTGYFLYHKFYIYNPIEIKDTIVVSQQSSLDINSASITPSPRFTSIEGKIKNTGEKALTNILIIYNVGYDTLSAFINYLDTGNSIGFKTNSCRVRQHNPNYSLEKIKFDFGS